MPNSEPGAGLPGDRAVTARSTDPSPATDVPEAVNVSGFDRTDSGSVDLARWTEVANRTLIGESVTTGHVDLIFVEVDEMAELNQTHMGHEGPTDVLSFPLDTEDDDFPELPLDGSDDSVDGPAPVHLGDVVVCPEVARRQAPQHCGSLEAELSLLIVHGVLHILGHDHVDPDETLIMQHRERVHLSSLGFAHPVPA